MSKITIDSDLLEQALEALNASMPHNNDMDGDWPSHIAARRALRAALEQPQIQSGGIPPNWNQEPVLPGGGLAKLYIPPQPQVEQEPVAEITGMDEYGPMLGWHKHWAEFPVGTKLYTRPQPKREPLTDEWIRMIYDECDAETGDEFVFAFARDIERAHGITGDQE